MLAVQAFANSPVVGVHALDYPLDVIYYLPHGFTNALILPHTMRFNQSAYAYQSATLAPLVFSELAKIQEGIVVVSKT